MAGGKGEGPLPAAFVMSPSYSLAGQPEPRAAPSSSVPPAALAQGPQECGNCSLSRANKLFALINTWDDVWP